jgi:hypothetical protein
MVFHRKSHNRNVAPIIMSLHRQGKTTVVIEVPRERLLVAAATTSRTCLLLVGGGCAAAAALSYALAPVCLFVLHAVFNLKTNDSLERLVYQTIPDAVTFLLLLYFGSALVYVGDRMMTSSRSARSLPPR